MRAFVESEMWIFARTCAVAWTALHGCAWLGGIGFTMSMFIAALAFSGTDLLDSATIGILIASVVSGVIGGTVLRRGLRSAPSRDGPKEPR